MFFKQSVHSEPEKCPLIPSSTSHTPMWHIDHAAGDGAVGNENPDFIADAGFFQTIACQRLDQNHFHPCVDGDADPAAVLFQLDNMAAQGVALGHTGFFPGI